MSTVSAPQAVASPMPVVEIYINYCSNGSAHPCLIVDKQAVLFFYGALALSQHIYRATNPLWFLYNCRVSAHVSRLTPGQLNRRPFFPGRPASFQLLCVRFLPRRPASSQLMCVPSARRQLRRACSIKSAIHLPLLLDKRVLIPRPKPASAPAHYSRSHEQKRSQSANHPTGYPRH